MRTSLLPTMWERDGGPITLANTPTKLLITLTSVTQIPAMP